MYEFLEIIEEIRVPYFRFTKVPGNFRQGLVWDTV